MVQFCYFILYLLGIETVSCCLLLPMAEDGYGLEFEKLGQLFLNFKLMPTKNHQKIILLCILR